MPRADRVSLSQEGLAIPPVDHLSNRSVTNILLDRAFSGVPAGIPPDRILVGLFVNFARLTDKALREYDAARTELLAYVAPGTSLQTSRYLRAIDHMENCISALHRTVLNARALRENKIGRAGPRLTERQERRLAYSRNAIEHADEKLTGTSKIKNFGRTDPFSLRLANTSTVIGDNVLTYQEIVSAMSKCHNNIEIIRGVPTGEPGPSFPNATLRTNPGTPANSNTTLRASTYLKELSRLTVTHS
ncbi:hypothetical protein ACFVYA_37665 [Amycolatopsis sp. NPDC058278]|uniref:hypothetical protein n=1 Tax=Amycolatopsis sp. NPDC058278 TaxID=3346417 RepID=UPI0036DD8997